MKNKIFVSISFVLFVFCFAVFYVGLQKPNIYTPKLDKQIELPNFVGNDFFSGEKVISDNLLKKIVIILLIYGHRGVFHVELSTHF